MTKLKVIFAAIDEELYLAWEPWCGDLNFVTVKYGSILDCNVDAVVSPANSFGFMDGGIDRVYLQRFGNIMQERVQDAIKKYYFGELLVGQSLIVDTEDSEIPFLISSPTMRVPDKVVNSVNPYLAARAVFLLVKYGRFLSGEFADELIKTHVRSIAFPGLGTGVGKVNAVQCARQVRAAIEDILMGKYKFPATTSQIRKRQDKFRSF